jgi:hypothetical protein
VRDAAEHARTRPAVTATLARVVAELERDLEAAETGDADVLGETAAVAEKVAGAVVGMALALSAAEPELPDADALGDDVALMLEQTFLHASDAADGAASFAAQMSERAPSASAAAASGLADARRLSTLGGGGGGGGGGDSAVLPAGGLSTSFSLRSSDGGGVCAPAPPYPCPAAFFNIKVARKLYEPRDDIAALMAEALDLVAGPSYDSEDAFWGTTGLFLFLAGVMPNTLGRAPFSSIAERAMRGALTSSPVSS